MGSRVHIARALSAILVVGALCASGMLVHAAQDMPDFDWDPTFASPGASLLVEVTHTMSGPPKGSIQIAIKASGFSEASDTLALWEQRAGRYYRYEPAMGADGAVQLLPGIDIMVLGGYIRGQTFDIALVDEATNKRAHAKIVPFPVTASGTGGCKASAEVVTKTGLVWLINLSGFGPDEEVEIASVTKKETLTNEFAVSETGDSVIPIMYPKRSKGRAQVSAVGSGGCSVTLDFAIGKSALKAK